MHITWRHDRSIISRSVSGRRFLDGGSRAGAAPVLWAVTGQKQIPGMLGQQQQHRAGEQPQADRNRWSFDAGSAAPSVQ